MEEDPAAFERDSGCTRPHGRRRRAGGHPGGCRPSTRRVAGRPLSPPRRTRRPFACGTDPVPARPGGVARGGGVHRPGGAAALAVRRKADSTVVRGLEAVRDGRADAFVSAGPTGATVVASVLTLGLLPGVDRPPVGALFPTGTGRVLVMDVGGKRGRPPAATVPVRAPGIDLSAQDALDRATAGGTSQHRGGRREGRRRHGDGPRPPLPTTPHWTSSVTWRDTDRDRGV